MMTQAFLASNATARLKMVSGNPCSMAEFFMFLEQYGYSEDSTDSTRFVFISQDSTSASDEACSIVVSDLNVPVEAMDIFGSDVEHFANLDTLMRKAGWRECSVESRDDDVAVKLLARLVNIKVSNANVVMPASTFSAGNASDEPHPTVRAATQISPVPTIPRPSVAEVSALESLEADHAKIVEMTIKANQLEEHNAELQSSNESLLNQNAELKRSNEILMARNGELTRQCDVNASELASARIECQAAKTAASQALANATAVREQHGNAAQHSKNPIPEGEHGTLPLHAFIEKHVIPAVDLTAGDSEILQDLRSVGYTVERRLVRAA